MENFIQVGGRKYPLSDAQAAALMEQVRRADVKLAEIKPGSIALIGEWEFVVLEQREDETVLILRELLEDDVRFGDNNRYDGSDVDGICCRFAKELAGAVGEDNLLEFEVDLTSDDGLKDYGSVFRKAALMTTEQYRKYVDVLDQKILEEWWWLATPSSTERHESAAWLKCVSPRGHFNIVNVNIVDVGVRPFCILKSNIFVSC